MGRGKKLCKSCGTATGPRAKICNNCHQPFSFKPKIFGKEPEKKVDWQKLKRGDRIRTMMGSGPYWQGRSEEKTYMGHYGKFTVLNVEDNGLEVLSEKAGYAFLYMGPTVTTEDGITRQAYSLKKLGRRL